MANLNKPSILEFPTLVVYVDYGFTGIQSVVDRVAAAEGRCFTRQAARFFFEAINPLLTNCLPSSTAATAGNRSFPARGLWT